MVFNTVFTKPKHEGHYGTRALQGLRRSLRDRYGHWASECTDDPGDEVEYTDLEFC